MVSEMEDRTLSRISVIQNDKNHSNGYEFTCWFGASVDFESDLSKARQVTFLPADVCYSPRGKGAVTLQALGVSRNINRNNLECLRSFLLMHGWEQSEEMSP
jgi:hypothetical protein